MEVQRIVDAMRQRDAARALELLGQLDFTSLTDHEAEELLDEAVELGNYDIFHSRPERQAPDRRPFAFIASRWHDLPRYQVLERLANCVPNDMWAVEMLFEAGLRFEDCVFVEERWCGPIQRFHDACDHLVDLLDDAGKRITLDLLKLGFPVRAWEISGDPRPAIAGIAARGDIEVLRILIDRGVNVNAHDAELVEYTALDRAVMDERWETVRLLLKGGADPTIPTWTNASALHRMRRIELNTTEEDPDLKAAADEMHAVACRLWDSGLAVGTRPGPWMPVPPS